MSRNVVTLSFVAAEGDLVELAAQVAWQTWAASDRVVTSRASLAAFASEIRDFAAHHRPEARFEAGSADSGLLAITVSEYGRTRKAAFGFHLARAGPPRGTLSWPTEFRIQLPTEHGLLGEFGADLAQLVAAEAGSATLRLLRRWPPG
jgi:hypothetical protein